MIKAVVFDMDGVIFDSETLVIKTWEMVAEKYGFSNVEKVCRKCLGTNAEATRKIFLDFYGEDFPYDKYKKEMSSLFHQYAAGGKLPKKTGVTEILEYLKENNIKTGLATSTRKDVVLKELDEGGILPFFDAVVCGDMVNRSKPEPDIYLEACRQLQTDPSLCCAVEDSYNGIRAASRAGMRAIMVPDIAEPTEEMKELAECILPSLLEVKKYLEEKIRG
ncbi:MAG TPA: HAD family phosphatase [Candidatus Blautia excrementipullorum]|nr:HAD family phosphatase [Candidatus Blautia excrementipullorum]